MDLTLRQIETLEKLEYVGVIIQIIDGKNYATAIAKALNKKQPTVTEQLNTLESLNIIKKIGRSKAKTYLVNFNLIYEYFYSMVGEFVSARKKGDDFGIFNVKELKKLNSKSIRDTIPKELIRGFLEFYAISAGLIGSKYKGFDEIVISFFGALEKINKSKKEYLIKVFKINERTFNTIINLMAFETVSVEKAAVETFLDETKKDTYK